MGRIKQVGDLFVKAIGGSRNDRMIRAFRKRVAPVNAFEPEIRKLTDAQLRERTAELRRRVADGEPASEVMYEAFAVAREAIDRNVGIRNIFNPVHAGQFDPSKLSGAGKQAYDQTLAEIEQLQPIEVIGGDEPVPPHLQVDIPVELYDAVRELHPKSRPPFRARCFDVQIVGGMVLYEGTIAEMKTGEGKTIVAPLACFMAAVEGMQCHVVTVNDYLVQRDRDWVFPAFHKLGMTVGAIHPNHMQPPEKKKEAYDCDVVYGTNSEFGFDYLRDNMKLSAAEQVQKRRDFCIVDEIDSILVDEARTPLIISGPARDDAPQYTQANSVAEQLVAKQRSANQETARVLGKDGFLEEAAKANKVAPAAIEKIVTKFRDLGPEFLDEKEADQIGHTQYYVVRREQKQANMTALGVEEAQKIVGTRFYVVGNDMGWDHLINNALRAHTVYEKDREYVVKDGEVVIVDEFTGRLMVGRQWSDGLHQAVEAKEARNGVKIKQETQTLATITIQNFFKLYKRLAGMTGTAVTEAQEFHEIYQLDAAAVPTNVPVIRDDANDLIFLNEKSKWDAIIDEIRMHAEAGRPVLVGTTSVDKSEMLGQMLTKRCGLEHEVLNAKQHEREAHIVAKAGQQHTDNRGRQVGNVTLSTNMAGRGTDIRLAPEVLWEVVDARDLPGEKGVKQYTIRQQASGEEQTFKSTDPRTQVYQVDRGDKIVGGLHVFGTERHESRRIDNQLRGRAGRQGDPGSSRFFISMEDDLMKMFAGKSTMKALNMLGMTDDDALEHKWITRSVERAQRKVEERNFQVRKNLLEYDEVMDYQRGAFYGTRQNALEGRGTKEMIFDYIAEAVEDAVAHYLDPDYAASQVAEAVRQMLHVTIDARKLRGEKLSDVEGQIRSDAKAEMRSEVENSLGEYMDPTLEPEEWDLSGLSSWAMSRFQVDLKQSRLREMEPPEVAEQLTEAAHEQIEKRSLEGLARFYERDYAESELAEWAQRKFGLELNIEDLREKSNERDEDRQQRVAEYIFNKAREQYARREIEYPVQFVMDTLAGAAQQGAEAGAWAADQLVRWSKNRFDIDWDAQTLSRMTGDEIYEQLVSASEQWNNGKLDQWVEQTVSGNPSDEALIDRFGDRWGVALDGEALAEAEDKAELVRDRAREILRTELTQLERYVLLQILDQTWKDHLYAMDQLKDAIGLQAYAEKDPKVMYKSEGARMFQEMLKTVRDKVTDLIFRARLTANVQMRNAYAEQTASHEHTDTTGVNASAMADAGTAEQQEDLAAADRAGGGERQVTQTIRRRQPKVGRNDPCPCGSGKKYKQCCGK